MGARSSTKTLDRPPPEARRLGGRRVVRDTPRPEDAEIVAGLRARDPSALEDLVDAYGRLIRSWTKAAGTEEEDAFQDVLLRVWKSGPQLSGDTFLPAWLKTVTQNALRDRWRSAARKPVVPVGLDIDSASTDHTPDTDSRLAIEQVLATLVPRERDVLKLLYVSDLSLNDAAQHLGLSEEATRSLAARARRRLRSRVQRMVAATPAGVMAVLVGRTAEAMGGAFKTACALGATAAAATVLAAGTVTYHRATAPETPPAAVHAEMVVEATPAAGPAPTNLSAPPDQAGSHTPTAVVPPAGESRLPESGQGGPTNSPALEGGQVDTGKPECPKVDHKAPGKGPADESTAVPENEPNGPGNGQGSQGCGNNPSHEDEEPQQSQPGPLDGGSNSVHGPGYGPDDNPGRGPTDNPGRGPTDNPGRGPDDNPGRGSRSA